MVRDSVTHSSVVLSFRMPETKNQNMSSNEVKELLKSHSASEVLFIYLKDFRDIFVGAFLSMLAIGKELLFLTLATVRWLSQEVGDSLVNEFKYIFDFGPVPHNFDYSYMAV